MIFFFGPKIEKTAYKKKFKALQVSKGTSHTYTLRLDYSRISILYKKKKINECDL